MPEFSRRTFLQTALLSSGGTCLGIPRPVLPHWRGFNLLEKFSRDWNYGPFVENDFRWISELGFNFVRLPMDYRCWITDGDWRSFKEATLHEIDQAVEWGRKYGLHVCINFHRAPGYTVASPKEATSLWTDAETQEVCALHWATFAKRYKGIPGRELSFNLLNEPVGTDSANYAAVAGRLIEAIRSEDPERWIISDGLEWCRVPCMELPNEIIQATRGYVPMNISHYQAGWVSGSDAMPVPQWPMVDANGFLYAPAKQELHAPLLISGDFLEATLLRLRVGQVSDRATLGIKADGCEIHSKEFLCGAGDGEWEHSDYKPQWQIYQCRYNRDYSFKLPAGVQTLELSVKSGDWMALSELELFGQTIRFKQEYGKKPPHLLLQKTSKGWNLQSSQPNDEKWLWNETIEPWRNYEARGGHVLVGEWGAYNKTPHEVTLQWMEENLKNWKRAGWGWALWNFRGPFGIFDSARSDVDYELWNGHQLDRRMLNLLRRH